MMHELTEGLKCQYLVLYSLYVDICSTYLNHGLTQLFPYGLQEQVNNL